MTEALKWPLTRGFVLTDGYCWCPNCNVELLRWIATIVMAAVDDRLIAFTRIRCARPKKLDTQ